MSAMHSPSADQLLAACSHLSVGDRADIEKAFAFALTKHEGQKREDGSPYVSHVIAVATIVALWKADRDTVIAALLHDTVEDTATTKEEIATAFGRHVALLVEGITKFTQVDLNSDLALERKTETLRKLFDVMRLDLRSILIKLADRLHNIQTIESLPLARRKRFAVESMSVYYKIAFHLGMRQLRREFAEACIPYIFDTGTIDLKRRDALCIAYRDLPMTIERALHSLAESRPVPSVLFQPRNLQIFHDLCLTRKGVALSQDAFSIVVLVPNEEECYHFLKSIHTLYRPIVGHFRDFIASPSDAGYRSLHTHVALEDSSIIEIRIYTPTMYDQAMLGIAYTLFHDVDSTLNFSWLERTQELDIKTRQSSSAFWEALESDILRETISVTVDRSRVSLPRGATTLDAAFALYDTDAVKTKQIALNGVPSSFAHVLKEDDNLHITLHSAVQTEFGWLDAVHTKHARLLISEELKHHSRAEKVTLGATLLQKELDHYGKGLLQHLSRTQCNAAARHFARESFDQVLAMIGEGVLRSRDVLFTLFPDHKPSLFHRKAVDRYSFHLSISFNAAVEDPLVIVSEIARSTMVSIDAVKLQQAGDTMSVQIAGHALSRTHFADFVEQLDRHESCTQLQMMIPTPKKAILISSFVLAFLIILFDVIAYPYYADSLNNFGFLPRMLLQALPLIPMLLANLYLLRLLHRHIVRMRNDRWFLVIGFLLNVVGLLVLTLQIASSSGVGSLLPLIALFTLSLLYIGYRFLKTEALLAPFDEQTLQPVPEVQWRVIKKRKMAGYAIRLVAVFIWGLEPIVIRYSPVNDVSPFLRTFLFALGVLLPMGTAYFLFSFLRQRKLPKLSLPYEHTFFLIVIGQVGFMYFMNASLIYTSGTNLLLFNNFAPLIALIIAAFFWRKDIPYLKQPRVMMSIFLLAITAGIGSSLLMRNSFALESSWTVVGDILAMCATFFDVMLVVGQIQYIKSFQKTNGILLNLHIFSFVLLFLAPIIIVGSIVYPDFLRGLTYTSMLTALGIGFMIGCGQLLNYEAFKRIDGYLAFMMFNFAILITFVIEAFVLKSIQPTFILVFSGLMIIGASISAEILNSRCEKKGM